MAGNSDEEILNAGQVVFLTNKIRDGDPDIEGSRLLLKLFCQRAKTLAFPRSPFPDALLTLVAEAFEKYLSGEERNLEKSLGLVRKGRPPNPEIEMRNVMIAADVVRLRQQGRSVKDSASEQGAFADVAEKYGLSESEVDKIYYTHRDDGIAQVLMETPKLFDDKDDVPQ